MKLEVFSKGRVCLWVLLGKAHLCSCAGMVNMRSAVHITQSLRSRQHYSAAQSHCYSARNQPSVVVFHPSLHLGQAPAHGKLYVRVKCYLEIECIKTKMFYHVCIQSVYK